jgi:hypothetical protein
VSSEISLLVVANIRASCSALTIVSAESGLDIRMSRKFPQDRGNSSQSTSATCSRSSKRANEQAKRNELEKALRFLRLTRNKDFHDFPSRTELTAGGYFAKRNGFFCDPNLQKLGSSIALALGGRADKTYRERGGNGTGSLVL